MIPRNLAVPTIPATPGMRALEYPVLFRNTPAPIAGKDFMRRSPHLLSAGRFWS